MSGSPNHPAPCVFLSYASADRARALRVAELLEAREVSVWLDRRSITGGTSWSKVGAKHEVAWALITDAQLSFLEGDRAAVRPMFLETLAIAREAHDRTSTTQALNGLGRVADAAGEHAQAEAFYREALRTGDDDRAGRNVCAGGDERLSASRR